jgi:hypothetical protein
MAVTIKAYGNFPLNCFKKLVTDLNAVGTTVKGALLTSSYTFTQDTHVSYNDLTNEVSASGTGYTTGGNELTGKAVTYATRVTTWGITTPYTLTFSTVTIPDVRYLAIYDATPATAATKMLICCVDLGATYAFSAGNLVFTFNASGILTITCPA